MFSYKKIEKAVIYFTSLHNLTGLKENSAESTDSPESFVDYPKELVWDRKKAYKILADSNIDWGQNEWYLAQHIKKHPEVRVNPESPVAGRIAVSINQLVGIFDPEKYRWLRENFEPVDSIAYSYLIYDVSSEDLKKICGK